MGTFFKCNIYVHNRDERSLQLKVPTVYTALNQIDVLPLGAEHLKSFNLLDV